MGDLRPGRGRTRAGQHRGCSGNLRQGIGRGGVTEQTAAAKIIRQAERDAGAAGDQSKIGRRRADRFEIAVFDGVDNRMGKAVAPEPREGLADRRHAARHVLMRHQPNLAAALPLQHPHEARVAHRRQRVVAHPRFRQQHVADEQVTLVDRPLGFRKSRAEQREIGVEGGHQRFRHRADIAAIGRIKGRAVFEQDLPRSRPLQPGECRETDVDRLPGGDRAALQRHDDRLGVADPVRARGHPDQLHGAHPAPHEGVAQIRGAGEIVGDRSQQHSHRRSSGAAARPAK
jgi:hypothetical protein